MRQYDSHARDRRRAAGELGSSRDTDGHGAARLLPLAARPPLRSRGSDLAEPRPLRPLGRARLDASLRAPPPDRHEGGGRPLRGAGRTVRDARRHPPLPAARQQVPGASRVPLDLRRGDDHRSPRPGGRDERRDGDRRPVAGRALQPAGLLDVRLRRLRPRRRRRHDGGSLGRGGLAGGPSPPRKSVLVLRQQPRDDRGLHGARLQRGRRGALPRLRLERHARR